MFLGESCHNIDFAYLLCPIMLKHLKKSLRSHNEMLGCIMLRQIWPELPIFPKREFFGKFKYYIYLPTAPPIC